MLLPIETYPLFLLREDTPLKISPRKAEDRGRKGGGTSAFPRRRAHLSVGLFSGPSTEGT